MLTLIEARPGAGKTTTLQRLAELLRERGATLAGFVTEELGLWRSAPIRRVSREPDLAPDGSPRLGR